MIVKWAAVCAVSLLLGTGLDAQTASLSPPARTMPGELSPPAVSAGFSESAGSAGNPFLGSRSTGAVQAEPLDLSLADAIRRGLRNNLGAVLGEQQRQLAMGAHQQVRSLLLPNLAAGVSERVSQVNLAAFGFSGFPGISPIVGPFSVADARVYLRQPVFDLPSLHSSRAGAESVKAAGFSYRNAREIVVLVVTNLYLQTIAAASRVETAEAQVSTAKALYDQAVAFREAGVAPAIVRLRAQVELKVRQQSLIQARNALEKSKLSLGRVVGLPGGQRLRLTSSFSYAPPPQLTVKSALEQAYRERPDYKSSAALLRAAEQARKAASSERLPSLAFEGDYGAIGQTPGRSHGTFTVAATLNIPIFQGGRIRGEETQARARLEQQRARLDDLRGRIEHEIRTALLDVSAANERVGVARAARELARQEMTQARDRFAAGVTDNVEVVQAQQSLAAAEESFIASLYAYNAAKIVLAKALGVAEARYQDFLAPTKN